MLRPEFMRIAPENNFDASALILNHRCQIGKRRYSSRAPKTVAMTVICKF